MESKERKYFVLDDILDWLGFEYHFNDKKPEYPFNRSYSTNFEGRW